MMKLKKIVLFNTKKYSYKSSTEYASFWRIFAFVLNSFLMETKFILKCAFWWVELFVFIDDIGVEFQYDFSFRILIKFISKLTKNITINNITLDSSFLIMLGKFFFVNIAIDSNSSLYDITFLFSDVSIFGKFTFFLEILP